LLQQLGMHLYNSKFSLLKTFILISTFNLLNSAYANICGNDLQSFNPTYSGLDFITVHSSETLEPCKGSLGAFLNISRNNLSVTREVTSDLPEGSELNDTLLYLDVSLGFGLVKDWDIGVNVSGLLYQDLGDVPDGLSFTSTGLTDLRFTTKYRAVGDASGGIAGVFSINQNLVADNPFAGEGSGPTMNFELVGDHTFGDLALALNLGYRKRSPGTQIDLAPFEPLEDQYIYSLAANYYIETIDTKIVAEYVAAESASDNLALKEALRSSEFILGTKLDLSQKSSLAMGFGTEVQNSTASPDWRIFAGYTRSFDAFCDSNKSSTKTGSSGRHLQFLTDGTINFGSVMVGESKSYSISIKNVTDRELKITRNSKLPAPFKYYGGKFPGKGGTCAGMLKSGQECEMVVEFAPTEAGFFNPTLKLLSEDLKDNKKIAAKSIVARATAIELQQTVVTEYKTKDPEVVTLDSAVLFATASIEIQQTATQELQKIVNELNRGFSYMIIEGHTDSIGDEAYNLKLSQGRAKSIKAYLVNQAGLSASKIEALGFGESKPVGDNGNEQGRQFNRRVEFRIWR
jgi:outer membrane protein OmpA-like peptidoglycan-associated protein